MKAASAIIILARIVALSAVVLAAGLPASPAGAQGSGKARKVLACKDLAAVAKRLATGEGANPVEEQDGQDAPESGQDHSPQGGAAQAEPGQNEADDDDVIEAEGPVTASDPKAVPPYIVLCDGAPRLACIMETPLPDATPGRVVHLMGRLTEGDNRMLVVDPCGASLGR